jgi:bifunctional non-homologous end joining protein LigD
MAKSLRAGRIFIDWSQNNPAKTTVSTYSLRALDRPSVSTPLTWDEVEAGAARGAGHLLRFSPHEVLDRVQAMGDLLEPVLL